MIHYLRRVFWYSVLFYVAILVYTRFSDSQPLDFFTRVGYSIALDDGREKIRLQLCNLSSSEVATLLEGNDTEPVKCAQNIPLIITEPKEYIVLRYGNLRHGKWGDLKLYFSCFRYPIEIPIFAPNRIPDYRNVIIPYPANIHTGTEEPCKISTKWKNSWGYP